MAIPLWKPIAIPILLIGLTGCSTILEQSVVKSPETPAQIAPVNKQIQTQTQTEVCLAKAPSEKTTKAVTEVPYAYDKMTEAVVIQLDEEPRLHSPINTTVGPYPQTYTLFFREPMDRASVERSIETNTAKKDQTNAPVVHPSFTYQWTSDRQLHLKVEVPAKSIPRTSDYGMSQYLITPQGALTKNNKPLAETPQFTALIEQPEDLWMISSDGQQEKHVGALTQPYFIDTAAVNLDPRYFMLKRYTQYCECDANYPYLYALYDLQNRQTIYYPMELMTRYWGDGEFIADTRGFFYAKPDSSVTVPASPTAVPIKINGFVHGGNFSKNRTHLFLAVGTKEQTKDYDLIVYELATGKQKRYPAALKGEVAFSEVTTAEIGVSFYDNGQTVTTRMLVPNKNEEIRYQYDWQTRQISQWKPPIPSDVWSGYTASDDGKYQLYANGGLYQGSRLISGDNPYEIWLGNTHQLVSSVQSYSTTKAFPQEGLYLFDADTAKIKRISTATNRVIGSSPDGKWIYVEGKPGGE
ncbi:hypothetical protein ACQCN2_09105 [Brevibacillus ginsengisoli]|uniref:hypothetical protein n=1 Tax=Brevibacillus ginsengisoli TaxID=363854 RepID=UPI003CF500A0